MVSRVYERGEGRYKHRWKHDYAGFEPSPNGPVGKCPKSITEAIATDILDQGIPYYANPGDPQPSRIYSVHKGVVYEAAPTTPGVSWHGYPWRGDLQGRPILPRRILRGLRDLAVKNGFEKEYDEWLNQYS